MQERPDNSDVSRYDHLLQVKKSGGNPPELENIPELSDYGLYIWGIFSTFKDVSYAEIHAYNQVMGDELKPWEARIMLSLSTVKYNTKRPV